MSEILVSFWPWLSSAVLLGIDLWATGHVVLFKRHTRSAIGWVGLIWLVPVAGPILYLLFGINRIQRKARRLRGRVGFVGDAGGEGEGTSGNFLELEELGRFVTRLTNRPCLVGNLVTPLPSGELAYTAMLEGIGSAKKTIGLSTYIFDNDKTGEAFVQALAEAVGRGVSVRVLVDDIGSRYSFPSIFGRLRSAGVPVASFMPTLVPWLFAYAQLRNHRKILVLDGRIGFTGGMNIRDSHDCRRGSKNPAADCHFALAGPVVADLVNVFADDWQFAKGERLAGDGWFPSLVPAGDCQARGIASGPDDRHETLRMTFLGAIACAKKSIRIATPYFLPDSDLLSALNVASLRGVQVDIVVPQQSNLRLVHWAMRGIHGQVLEYGCNLWLSPAPFDHAKLFVVDDHWCLIGSANWDSRSLRLNFEFDVECHGGSVAEVVVGMIEKRLQTSHRLSRQELAGRGLPGRLRDGLARLASPYL